MTTPTRRFARMAIVGGVLLAIAARVARPLVQFTPIDRLPDRHLLVGVTIGVSGSLAMLIAPRSMPLAVSLLFVIYTLLVPLRLRTRPEFFRSALIVCAITRVRRERPSV